MFVGWKVTWHDVSERNGSFNALTSIHIETAEENVTLCCILEPPLTSECPFQLLLKLNHCIVVERTWNLRLCLQFRSLQVLKIVAYVQCHVFLARPLSSKWGEVEGKSSGSWNYRSIGIAKWRCTLTDSHTPLIAYFCYWTRPSLRRIVFAAITSKKLNWTLVETHWLVNFVLKELFGSEFLLTSRDIFG
jgi:hypothetical protein